MQTQRQAVTISAAQWNAKRARGQTAVVSNTPYIVSMNEVTHEPVYLSVAIVENVESAVTQASS